MQTNVLIIGAGLTGLMAGQQLQADGQHVLLLEQEDQVGGRMATRQIGPGYADLGAQFFTVRTPKFRAYVDQWIAANLVFEWSRGWSDGSLSGFRPDGFPRYAVHGGMTAVPQFLSQNLHILTGVKLLSLSPIEDGWQAVDTAGQVYHSRAVLLTPPVPVSLQLLQAGHTTLHPTDRTALQNLTYAPCLCGVFWVKGKVHLPESGAVQRPLSPISWIADNHRKGLSPAATLITVHGSPRFSQEHAHQSDDHIINQMLAAIRPHLDPISAIQEAYLHRWPHALPYQLHPERSLTAQDLPPLLFAGDAFKEPRVEGAVLSGLAAAENLKQRLV